MKFLVFNVIVLCSLGYLLTSKPNQNLIQWASNAKDKITNLTKEEVVKTIRKGTSSHKLIEDNQIKKTSGEIKKVNTDTNLNKDKKVTNEIKAKERTKIASSDRNEDKEKKPVDNEIKKIINDILEAKNKNSFQEKVKTADGEVFEKEKINKRESLS